MGQVMLLESTGDYKSLQAYDPKKPAFPIYTILPYQFGGINHAEPASGQAQKGQRQGFIVAGENGMFRVFHKSDTDVRMPYKRVEGEDLQPTPIHEKDNKILWQDIMYHKTLGMTLSPREDVIVFTTDSNQIVRVDINLERPFAEQTYTYLVSAFHSKQIYGLDICIKKQLFATCGTDRTVRIWSYRDSKDTFKMEFYQQFEEPAMCLALHPSGLHIIVGF
jgi:WD40 repeat protein